jgi:hypothetical protein
MIKPYQSMVACVLLAFLFATHPTQPAHAAGNIVNTNADNTTAGDGFCTLREAITNANANSDSTSGDCVAGSGADTITFAADYTITLNGTSLPDITSTLTITGNGAAHTIVQGAASAGIATSRILKINGGTAIATLEAMTIRYGVEASGGGLNNASGSLTLNNVVVSDNLVTVVGGSSLNGGGISTNGGSLTLNNSTVSGNRTMNPSDATRGNGGGIFSGASSVTLNNSTVSGNSAAGNGGGVYINASGGTLNLNYSTVANNTSDSDDDAAGNGGGVGNASTLKLKSSIVAGNKKGTISPVDDDCTGTITDQDYNLTGSGTGCTLSGSHNVTVSPSSVFTAVLGSLTNNGGNTETHALLAGSPALDVIAGGTNGCGTTYTTDQRGETRPISGNCDIGAYESPDTTAPTVVSSARANANPTNAASVDFSVTFSEAVTGVDTSDFSPVTAAGVTGASVTGVSGGPAVYTVSVSTGSGSGTLQLDLLDDDSIADSAGNHLGGSGSANGNFSTGELYSIDKTAPTAGSLVAANITIAGGTTYSFTVGFSDNLAIDITSIDGNDIRVSGPGGFNQLATLVSVTPADNGTPRTATYQITAPGGAWESMDRGAYTIAVEANQIFDSAGNPAGAISLGSFLVSLNSIYLPLVR